MQDDGWSIARHARNDHALGSAMWGASGLSINDRPHIAFVTSLRTIDFGFCHPAVYLCLTGELDLARLSGKRHITSSGIGSRSRRVTADNDTAGLRRVASLSIHHAVRY